MVGPIDRLVKRAGKRATFAFIAAAVVLVLLIALLGREAAHHVAAVERWIAALGPTGVVVFVGLLVLGTSVFIPESLFAVAAGVVFGLWPGFIAVLIGNVVAALLQYLLARRTLHDPIQRTLAARPQLAAIQRAVLRDETRLQLLLRLTPLNAASLSYVFGAAGVRFAGFVLACVGLIPHVLMEVYLGHAGYQLTRLSGGGRPHSLLHESVTFGGLVITAILVFVVSRIARRTIERTLAE
jgi:uncharacterized membrane protein YdjX (TVP38/TMEM64 family)